jgi:hypothetical protein
LSPPWLKNDTHDTGGGSFLPALPSLPSRLTARGFPEVIVRDLGVVLDGHFRRVSQPCTDNVGGELLQKLGFAAQPLILKALWPRFDLGLVARLRPRQGSR